MTTCCMVRWVNISGTVTTGMSSARNIVDKTPTWATASLQADATIQGHFLDTASARVTITHACAHFFRDDGRARGSGRASAGECGYASYQQAEAHALCVCGRSEEHTSELQSQF